MCLSIILLVDFAVYTDMFKWSFGIDDGSLRVRRGIYRTIDTLLEEVL